MPARPCQCCKSTIPHTLILVDADGDVNLYLDFNADSKSVGGGGWPSGGVAGCDVDADGNLYQVGGATQPTVGGHLTFGTVASIIDETHFVFQNDGNRVNAASGTGFAPGASVVDASVASDNAACSVMTNTAVDFFQPDASFTVTIEVLDTSWMSVGQEIYINDAYATPMATVRSWDSEGNPRWSWSENPFGQYGAGIYEEAFVGPTPQVGCRAIPSDGGIIVSDNYLYNSVIVDSVYQTFTYATKLDSDGNIVWRVAIGAGYQIVGCSENRSLWQPGGNGTAPWMLIDNENGSIIFTKSEYPSLLGGEAVPTGIEGPIQNCPFVAIDGDGHVYEMLNYNFGSSDNFVVISRYSDDGGTTDWSVMCPFTTFLPAPAGGGLSLGSGRQIIVGSESIYVSSGGAAVAMGVAKAAGVCMAIIDPASGSTNSIVQLLTSASQEWVAPHIWFVDEDNDLLALTTASLTELRGTDGARFKIWEPTSSGFLDARAAGEGWSLWSQGRNTIPYAPGPDFLPDPVTCEDTASYESEAAIVDGLPGFAWGEPTGCDSDCFGLPASIVNFVSLLGQVGSEDDPQFTSPIAVPTEEGDSFELPCIPNSPVLITCTGGADFTSADNGDGGFEWVMVDSDCSDGCSPEQPSTVPTKLDQNTSTSCLS